MKYLTRLTLSPEDIYQHRIYDAYGIHRVVYGLFKDEDKSARILFVDKGRYREKRQILILSDVKPASDSFCFESKPIDPNFFNAKHYAFEILLNPVIRANQTRKYVPIEGELPLLQWFIRTAEKHGISADESTLQARTIPAMRFNQNKLERCYHSVIFSGKLTVKDPEKFKVAFANGIGRAKAFGFGLLQLVPLI